MEGAIAPRGGRVRVWFMDEARFGQQGTITDVWAKRGSRPRAVRQTRYDSLVLPSRGRGGRWTTDAWTELAGFTVNGGVRFAF